MTVDDENSIYVGGLPYDATEETLRRVFDLYGAIVAVKIVNDRGVGGKCYGFVTFRNPRSVVSAISDMDGRTIDGRVVKVNEVKTRIGRSNVSREGYGRNAQKRYDWDNDRNSARDYGPEMTRFPDRNKNSYQDREWDRGRDRSRDRNQDKDNGHDHVHYHDSRLKNQISDGNHNERLDTNGYDQEPPHGCDNTWDRGHALDRDLDEEMENTAVDGKVNNDQKSQLSRKMNRRDSAFNEHLGTEVSSDSSIGHQNKVARQLERSIQKRDELKDEISQIKETLEERQHLIDDLQKKSLKLEDSLTSRKKLTSQRRVQLTKLHRCHLQVKDYSDRLKSSEHELQSLVDTAMVEGGLDKDG